MSGVVQRDHGERKRRLPGEDREAIGDRVPDPDGSAEPLLAIAAIRGVEQDWQARTPPGVLMLRAATAVVGAVIARREPGSTEPVLLMVGPGNNGGDALVAGRLLLARGVPVIATVVPELLHASPRAADAARAWSAWPDGRSYPLESLPALLARHPRAIVVDGLLGIGTGRPIAGALAQIVAVVNAMAGTVVAIDVPSGLDADRGVAVGNGAVVQAHHTVTMIADKPGLHTGIGRAASGRVQVATLRDPVDGEVDGLFLPPVRGSGTLLTAAAVAPLAPWRGDDAHKGSHGDVLVVGGRLGMGGAACLAARGAIAGGAGRVSIVEAASDGRAAVRSGPIDPGRPEIMRRLVPARGRLFAGRAPVLVVGCGLGRDAGARRWLHRVLDAEATAVVDADALTLLATIDDARRRLRHRSVRGQGTVLTPHPLEAARLLRTTVAAITADRVDAARRLAADLGAVVVLKGAGSIVASPCGHYAINDSGHPVLATGGSGDVLAGLIGALAATAIAAGDAPVYAAARAACVGTWVHGAAGQWLAREVGPFGVPAGRIADAVPAVWGALSRIRADVSTEG